MKNKKDLRVIKTQNTIYAALLELMKEKTFEEIKVSDICNKALINRSTFYAHFEDKYDLLSYLIKDLKASLTEELKKNKNIETTKEYYIEMIKLFLNHIEEKKESYLSIMVNNRNSIMVDMVYDVINHDIIDHLKEDTRLEKNKIPRSIIAKFYLGAVVNIGMEWLKNMEYSKEDLIKYLDILIPDKIEI